MKINLKALLAINEMFMSLNRMDRWTQFMTEHKYNELAKQALNCIITYILACYAEMNGKIVQWERFPKIAIYRAFQKANVCFDMPEPLLKELCEIGEINEDAFNKATSEIIAEKTSKEFADYLQQGLDTNEMRIYRVATKIATNIELIENNCKISNQRYCEISLDIQKHLEEYADICGVKEVSNTSSQVFQAISQISNLRNQTRWKGRAYQIECFVLGHLFETAVWAYCIALEEKPGDEKYAALMFFMGIWHDVAETWTTDIPSSIKDRIPKFRKATEIFESKKLSEELYQKLPDFLVDDLKRVMFEEEENEKKYKKLIKGADYISADSECWRQYFAGSRDPYFYEATLRNRQKEKDGKIFLTPEIKRLRDYFKRYEESLNLYPAFGD